MRLRVSILAALAVAASLTPAALARQSAAPDYKALVDDYRAGRRGAIDRAAAAAAPDVNGWIDRAAAADSGWDLDALRAAVILHTEVWSIAVHNQRSDTFALHLNAAIRLLQRVRDLAPRQSSFIDRWRTFVGGLLRRSGYRGMEADFEARMAPLFPPHPLRQTALRPFLLGLDAEREAAEQQKASEFDIASTRPRPLMAASVAYLDALNRDPEHDLARLHLGRVRIGLGAWREAAEDFNRVLTADDPRVRYLALLFLGSIAERDGRYDEAERSYVAAVKIYPLGQAWALALSQVLSRTGREAEARKAIAVLADRRGNMVEPLWTYLPPASLDLVDLQMSFNELRAEVIR